MRAISSVLSRDSAPVADRRQHRQPPPLPNSEWTVCGRFNLGGPLSDQVLQIVHDQQVCVAICCGSRRGGSPQGFEELVGELLGGYVDTRFPTALRTSGRADFSHRRAFATLAVPSMKNSEFNTACSAMSS